MKLTDKQLENLLLRAFDQLDKTKESCKVTVSQCLQSPNQHLTNNVIRACLETMDTTELCKMFIINRSPNIKHGVALTLKVLKTNSDECQSLKSDKLCSDMVIFCSKILNETYKTLKTLHDDL